MKQKSVSARASRLLTTGSPLRMVLLAFIVSFVVYVYVFPFSRVPKDVVARADYLSYYTGAKLIQEGRGDLIYNLEEQHSLQLRLIKPFVSSHPHPFKAPPFVGLVFLPFSLVSYFFSYKVFAVASILLLFVFDLFVMRLLPDVKKLSYWFLVPFLFYPVIQVALFGQISLILLLVLFLIYYYLKSGKPFAAGLVSGFLLLKPTYILMLPFIFLITDKRRRYFSGVLISVGVLFVTSVILAGFEAVLSYPEFLFATENLKYGVPLLYLFSFVSNLLNVPVIGGYDYYFLLTINFILYFAGLLLFFKEYKQIGLERSFVVATLLSLVFGVHVLLHDLTLLLIPIFILLNLHYKKDKNKVPYGLFVVVILFLLPLVVFIPATYLGSIVLCLMAIWVVYSKRVLKYVENR